MKQRLVGPARRAATATLDRFVRFATPRPWARRRLERAFGRPSLHELSLLAELRQSPDAFLTELLGAPWTDRRDEVMGEFAEVQAAITARSSTVEARYPSFFTVEDGTAVVLYAIVRVLAPSVVVETGVADGRSTATMLAAMQRNGVGHLHSIDIADDVGGLVADRGRWTLHVVAPDDPLDVVLAPIGAVDIFLHDADHTPAGQGRDATAAVGAVRPGGLFLSDDADWSYAFHDTCVDRAVAPVLLLDRRKVFAALRL